MLLPIVQNTKTHLSLLSAEKIFLLCSLWGKVFITGVFDSQEIDDFKSFVRTEVLQKVCSSERLRAT